MTDMLDDNNSLKVTSMSNPNNEKTLELRSRSNSKVEWQGGKFLIKQKLVLNSNARTAYYKCR
ncbi:hypothetical protein CWR45_17765 [Oceanobacillus chungangensis]|uniref:Uncharacterized protein n=1 Tax=Oceanobacillus chungangensis TaxID=1229152 RepID=A0A3D8PK65_9BACI|nr:hypothetical protein CWR45_17765 [Oceanobacillus chungangensis]